MNRIVLAAAALALGATVVVAQGDVIAQRKALMKENGAQNRIATEMIEGKKPFDLAAAKKVLASFESSGAKIKSLFPDSSKTGDTAALPAIWEKKADFEAKLAKFSADSKAAASKVTDLNSFKAAMGDVRKNCGGCHTTYRKKT